MQALYYHEEFGSTDWRKLLRSRWQMLLVVLLAHLLLIILWPSIRLQKIEHVAPLALLIKMLDAPVAPEPEKITPAFKPSMPHRSTPAPVKTPAPTTSNSTASPAAPALVEPVSEAPVSVASTDKPAMIQRDISKVIKDVEREMPNRILTDIRPEKSSMVQFAINVAAAARPRGTSYQNIVLPDGTSMTKVTTAAGSYCVVGAKPGSDITRAPGTRTVTCGSY